MNSLCKTSAKIFFRLIDGDWNLGQSGKIDNTEESYMPVHVELHNESSLGPIFSIAHYFTQCGDLMSDPFMEFLVATTDGKVYPLVFEQHPFPGHQEAARITRDGSFRVNQRQQADITKFANQWMRNIKNQQFA